MQDSAKYLIHADITTSGVVERSDVVGAVFGQTEGLLGDDLDLRQLQDSSKVGRIDVDIDSEHGQSFGQITIASGLDRVETAVLAAALETIEQVGPCRATIEVRDIEDVRSAQRREIVDRATELLADFEAESVTSRDIVEAVRQRVRVEDVTEYEGLPAGPRVADSDAIVLVEGRSDVVQLLKYGIKNAIAVEGTDVPAAVADLARDRTVTVFLDGDRGGDLIYKELAQIADIDHVAFAPPGRAVEDLSRREVMSALRDKVPYETIADESEPRSVVADAPAPDDSTDGTVDGADEPATGAAEAPETPETPETAVDEAAGAVADEATSTSADEATETTVDGTARTSTAEAESDNTSEPETVVSVAGGGTDTAAVGTESEDTDPTTGDDPEVPETVAGHVEAIIGRETGRARLLDADATATETVDADEAFDAIESAATPPATVVVDGEVSQRLLDVAAQRGVGQIVGTGRGEFVKQPASVRVRLAEEF
ncbi:MAG: DNA primase DnaG [Haloarculaceae archaeon]